VAIFSIAHTVFVGWNLESNNNRKLILESAKVKVKKVKVIQILLYVSNGQSSFSFYQFTLFTVNAHPRQIVADKI